MSTLCLVPSLVGCGSRVDHQVCAAYLVVQKRYDPTFLDGMNLRNIKLLLASSTLCLPAAKIFKQRSEFICYRNATFRAFCIPAMVTASRGSCYDSTTHLHPKHSMFDCVALQEEAIVIRLVFRPPRALLWPSILLQAAAEAAVCTASPKSDPSHRSSPAAAAICCLNGACCRSGNPLFFVWRNNWDFAAFPFCLFHISFAIGIKSFHEHE